MWWMDIVIVLLLASGVYGFITLVRFNTRQLTRKIDRRAEDLYDNFADPPRSRHRGS